MFLWSEVKTLIIVPHPGHPSPTNHKDDQGNSRDNLEDIVMPVPALCYRFFQIGHFFYTTFIDQVTDANCCWTGS